jgi:hypothetical protein
MKQQITGYSHNIRYAIQFAMDHGFVIREEEDGWYLLAGHDSSEVDHIPKDGETALDARFIRAMVLKHDSEQRNELYRLNVENRLLRDILGMHNKRALDNIDELLDGLISQEKGSNN